MYAVIETGGKQYRVEVGTELQVELLDVEPGNTLTLDRVLLVADGDEAAIGRPLVDGATVSAEVLRQARGEKVISFKYRPKARTRVKKGHRQELTILRISDIVFGGKSAAKAAARAEQDAKTERQRLEEVAAAQAAKDAELAAKLNAPRKAAPKASAEDTTTGRAEAAEAAEAPERPKRSTRASQAAAAETTPEGETTAGAETAGETASSDAEGTDGPGAKAATPAADPVAEATATTEASSTKKAAKPRTTKKDE